MKLKSTVDISEPLPEAPLKTLENAGLFSRLTFSFATPLIRLGAKKQIRATTGPSFLPADHTAEHLIDTFHASYQKISIFYPHACPSNKLWLTFGSCHKRILSWQCILCLGEIGLRLAGPLLLRQFLDWIIGYEESNGDTALYPTAQGWGWAISLAIVGYLYTLFHHQLFYLGMQLGFKMRIQAMAAVHAKVLSLNSASLASQTTGKIINLVSNDVRRFDDAAIFWLFIIFAPLELILVFILLGLRIGYLSAFSGCAVLMLLIPVQGSLVRRIGRLRSGAAGQTDERVRLTGEAVSGVLAAKLLSWELPLQQQIESIRRREAHYIMKMALIRGLNFSFSYSIVPIAALAAFGVASATSTFFSVSDVFYTLALLALPKLYMCDFFTYAVGLLSESRVSVRRLGAFLAIPDSSTPWHAKEAQAACSEPPVVLEHCSFDWSVDGESERKDTRMKTLSDINLTIRKGELVAIVGPVGAGKTSLLSSLLGELRLVDVGADTNVKVRGPVAYASQIPWLLSGTVRENILFGLPLDQQLLDRVLQATALEEDIASLPAGVDTELGERGVNLSGGQKARCALARAAYSGAPLQLLDDPLSAVDPRVGQILFEECIAGVLAGSTRLLVTHQKQYLPLCDRIVVLRGGRIVHMGTYSELADLGIEEVVVAPMLDDTGSDHPLSGSLDSRKGSLSMILSARRLSSKSTASMRQSRRSFLAVEKTKSGRLIVDEDRATGSVSWSVYGQYILHLGLMYALIIVTLLLGGHALVLYSEYWLSLWGGAPDQQQAKWLYVYALFAGCIVGIALIRSELFFLRNVAAATSIHNKMIKRVLRTPLSFFHTNPTGRILNRFSRDQGAVDEQLPQVTADAVQALVACLGSLILLSVVIPVILPVFIPLIVAFLFVGSRYLGASREIKRFESVTRSPVYASFGSTLKGLAIIRAYSGASLRCKTTFLRGLSENGSWWLCYVTSSRWLGFRLDFLVAVLMTAAPLLVMAVHQDISAKLVGLALTQALTLSGCLQWMVRQSAEVENNMTSVERMLHYCEIEQEPPTVAEGGPQPPHGWPECPEIVYENVTAVYRPESPPVLINITFTLEAGVIAGVCGRTGSGKSSLLLTLFRLIPVTSGRILIGGIDITSMGLDALRNQIAIIPQDPVLFSGTLRSNLDPWSKYPDHKIYEALQKVKLEATVVGKGGLDSPMQESGDNLSAGQRQLLCLARALLRDAPIVALDEATANVDRATDAAIQSAIRGAHGDRSKTMLIIAHRVDTILDSDRVLVLSAGHLEEMGPPGELLDKKDGVFSELVTAAQESFVIL